MPVSPIIGLLRGENQLPSLLDFEDGGCQGVAWRLASLHGEVANMSVVEFWENVEGRCFH